MSYAIKLITPDGDEEYVCTGFSDRPALFPSKARAQSEADFMAIQQNLDLVG